MVPPLVANMCEMCANQQIMQAKIDKIYYNSIRLKSEKRTAKKIFDVREENKGQTINNQQIM